MSHLLDPENLVVRDGLYRLYRDFFAKAERKRRWSLEDDIPWDQVNRSLKPAVADVVESFCALEMYLPDYISKALPLIRKNKGWSWFHANWGYEEAKHSLALGDWLLRSGLRSDEQMADMEDMVFQHEWDPPHDSASGMLIYAMVQELATFVHYRNLRVRVLENGGDPALAKLLDLIAIDERAHHHFYRRVTQLFLELDRSGTLEDLVVAEKATGRRRRVGRLRPHGHRFGPRRGSGLTQRRCPAADPVLVGEKIRRDAPPPRRAAAEARRRRGMRGRRCGRWRVGLTIEALRHISSILPPPRHGR
jgi:Fatty acid desaturase